MTPDQLPAYRLSSQRIDRPLRTPADGVAWMGAVQAQDYAGAKWTVGLRTQAATDADLEGAVAERQIVRTWPMRGTLHFVAPADVRWLLALAATRVVSRSAPRYRELELNGATFTRGFDVLTKALEGGHALTRAEVNARLEAAGIDPGGQRSYHLLSRAGMEGLVCFGPMQGKQPTFVLLDEWVPPAPVLDREAAQAELARRYFTSHGPATVHDFAWWCGLPMAEVRAGIAAAAPSLVSETFGDRTFWRAADASESGASPYRAHLLPGFDEYLLGYTDRRDVLDPAYVDRVNNKNGVFSALVIVDGRAVGTWKRTLKRDRMIVEVRPFETFDAETAGAVAEAADRLGAFVGLPAEQMPQG